MASLPRVTFGASFNYADVTAPTYTSSVIPAAGSTLVDTFNEPIHATITTTTGRSITLSGGAVTLSSPVVSGATVTWTLSRVVTSSETCSANAYTAPGTGIKDLAGNYLATFSGRQTDLVNSSTQSGASYLVNENFDGTGTASGWTNSGSPNWDYTTAILDGTHSLLCSAGTSTEYSFPSQSTAYAKFMLRVPTALPGATITVAGLRATDSSARALVRMNASGQLAVFANGSDSTFTTDAMSHSTTYYVWMTWSASGTCSVGWSTTDTRPTSGNKFTSKTGGTGTVEKVQLNSTNIFDRVQVSTSQLEGY